MNTVNSQGSAIETKFTAGGANTHLHEASKQWANRPADQRFESLGAITAHCRSRAMRSEARDVRNAKVHVEAASGGGLVINSEISACRPSHWAFGQLASAAKAPADYLRRLPAEKTADLLNYGLSTLADNERAKFMTIRPDGDGWGDEANELATLQAVTSPTYGRIWDVNVCEAVERVVERSGGAFHNPLAYGRDGKAVPSGLYASDRDCFLFMIDGGSLLEAGPRAQLNRGFFVSNSETGARKFRLVTFLFNVVCGNHIIWGARDINELSIRHTSGGPSRFDLEAMPMLKAYTERSTVEEMTVIKAAQARLLPAEPAERMKLGQRFRITGGEWKRAEEYANIEEGQFCTFWDLVQGLTAQARDLPFVDARVDLETRAGAILKALE